MNWKLSDSLTLFGADCCPVRYGFRALPERYLPMTFPSKKDMVSFIHRHYTEKLSLASIAASGSVCRSKCCALFKRYMRQSPIDFLNCYRLEVSRGLLENTSMSITQIATSCGFNHLSYYSRLFLRNYGCTPGDYRKKQD